VGCDLDFRITSKLSINLMQLHHRNLISDLMQLRHKLSACDEVSHYEWQINSS